MTNLPWILQSRTKLDSCYRCARNLVSSLGLNSHVPNTRSVSCGVRQYWNGPSGKVSSRIHLQVIGTVCPETAPSVMLFADSQRYIFNYGESLHRLICDLDICLDAGRIFLTGNSWAHIGGLSYVQYQPQAFEPYDGIQVYGPAGTEDFVNSLYVFSKRHYTNKTSIACTDLQTPACAPYSDDNIMIKPVLLSTVSAATSLSSSTLPDDSVCYICELTDPPGKFLAKKAEELGIPLGDSRKQLLMGNPITLEHGQVVNPSDVIEAPRPGQAFGIIDCPTADKMELLLNNTDFTAHQWNTNNKPLDVIVHMTPQIILQSQQYKSWMKGFGPVTKHILLNDISPACQRQLTMNNKLQTSLHSVNPEMFAVTNSGQALADCSLSENCVAAESGMVYNFRPLNKEGFSSNNKEQEPNTYWRVGDHVDSGLMQYADRTEDPGSPEYDITDPSEDFTVTFLGTGASKVSRLRNTTSILVQWSPSSSMLLDCGDGTYCQLHHHYGNNTNTVLASVNCVFVSHKHIDHHMGLVNLIVNRQKLTLEKKNEPLVIIGPDKLLDWLKFYNKRRKELQFRFLSFSDVKSGRVKNDMRQLVASLGLCKLSIVPVVHCDDSHGIVIAHASGWKIVYSGDCSPSGYLIREGADATLLIHDATFLPEYGEKAAKLTGHSTTEGAIGVARRMRARHTILTHFSQRYNLKKIVKTPLPPGFSVAFDHMTVMRRDLPNLDRMLPNIRRALFGNKPRHGGKRRLSDHGGNPVVLFPDTVGTHSRNNSLEFNLLEAFKYSSSR